MHVGGAATRSCTTKVDGIGESAITASVRLAARTGDGPEPMGLTHPHRNDQSIACLAHCVISVPRNQWGAFVRKQTSSGSRNPQHRSKLTRRRHGPLPASHQGAHPRVYFEPWISPLRAQRNSSPGTRPVSGLGAKNASKTIPIVIATMEDPVQQGFATSLAHPGGSTRGSTSRRGLAAHTPAFRIKIACNVVAACSFPGTRSKQGLRIFAAN